VTALKDLAAREMSQAHEATYLNHAASSPLPRRSAEALRQYVADRERVFHLYQAGRQDFDVSALRGKLGTLLGTPANAMAFVPTTTDGLSGLLNGIDWRPGDNLVVPANEFPGVLYAALNLARRGVEVRAMPVEGHLDLDRLGETLDQNTRAAVVSHVHWQTGHRIDLAEFSRICRGVGALSIVDAIQSLGQLPVEPVNAGIDALVAGSYKWLMAMPGTAVLYASERALDEITPDRAGWTSMETPVQGTPRFEWKRDATRFHVGGQCDPTLIVLERSVDLLLEVGVKAIAATLRGLTDRLIANLPEGLRVGSSLEPANRSGILSVTTGSSERDDALASRLVTAGVIVARRGNGIRVSPHWHNTAADIDRFLAVTGNALGNGR
jgi:cysteine desulfurase / selenocysteine lyase